MAPSPAQAPPASPAGAVATRGFSRVGGWPSAWTLCPRAKSTRIYSPFCAAEPELLAAGQTKLGEGRLNLRGLKPAGGDDAETERHAEEITHRYGGHAQIPPGGTAAVAPVTAAPIAEPASVRTRYASFRVDLPEYLDEELRMRAAIERATKTYLIIEALQRAGYRVKPEDLIADRRKTRFRQD